MPSIKSSTANKKHLNLQTQTIKKPQSVLEAVRNYLLRALASSNAENKVGKSLVMDLETSHIISMVMSQTEGINHDVFNFNILGQQQHDNSYLHGIYILRPTPQNFKQLVDEIRSPKFAAINLFFTNIVSESHLSMLAEADVNEIVCGVQELYLDFVPLADDLFILNQRRHSLKIFDGGEQTDSLGMGYRDGFSDEEQSSYAIEFERNLQGLLACLLALKKRPQVRYSRDSSICKDLAFSCVRSMNRESNLFGYRQGQSEPLLLILDRRDDPVTPLLQQQSYQAMVHELLGIDCGRVDLTKQLHKLCDDDNTTTFNLSKPTEKEIVLNVENDEFFRNSKSKNFGELGIEIRQLVNEYQSKSNIHQDIKSIDDMQRFVDHYPAFIKQSSHVTKHVAVVSQMSQIIEKRHLMDVSALEQELASIEDHQNAFNQLTKIIRDPKICNYDKLRLLMLYALRYENKTSEINELKALLRNRFYNTEEQIQQGFGTTRHSQSDFVSLVDFIKEFAGNNVRSGDLFSNKSFFSSTINVLQNTLKGVENIYTQHTPKLAQVLEQILKGRLKLSEYPLASDSSGPSRGSTKLIPGIIIVYIIGGATYEEALVVDRLNNGLSSSGNGNASTNNSSTNVLKNNGEENSNANSTKIRIDGKSPNSKIVLGSSTMHNSRSFIDDMLDLMQYRRRRFGGSRTAKDFGAGVNSANQYV